MPSGWRIADPQFSKTAQEMLSGEGAFLYGGRWNTKGNRVVYLGGNLSTAVMELLVHLGASSVLNNYSKMHVAFEDEHILFVDPDDLPDDWAVSSMEPTTQLIGDDWLSNQESLILRVPSVVVKGENNYLLNPLHPDFNSIQTGEITPFNFDPRVKM